MGENVWNNYVCACYCRSISVFTFFQNQMEMVYFNGIYLLIYLFRSEASKCTKVREDKSTFASLFVLLSMRFKSYFTADLAWSQLLLASCGKSSVALFTPDEVHTDIIKTFLELYRVLKNA